MGLFDQLGPALPVVGAVGAAFLQRKWALKDLERQNAYNHPRAQKERLRQAGLPLATMFGGQGGSTSEQPQNTQVDPSLGTAKGLESFYQNRMQTKQQQLMDEQMSQIASSKALTDQQTLTEKARTMREWANALNDRVNSQRNNETFNYEMFDNLGKGSMEGWSGQDTNLVRGLSRTRQQQELTRIATGLSNSLQGVELSNKDAKTKAEILHALSSSAEINMRIKNETARRQFQNEVLARWSQGGVDNMSAFKMLVVSLMNKFLY